MYASEDGPAIFVISVHAAGAAPLNRKRTDGGYSTIMRLLRLIGGGRREVPGSGKPTWNASCRGRDRGGLWRWSGWAHGSSRRCGIGKRRSRDGDYPCPA